MTIETTAVKLGGSVVTHKDRPNSFRHEVVSRLATELTTAGLPLILVHGTGSYGKPIALAWGYPSGWIPPDNAHLWARVRNHLTALHHQVLQALVEAGMPAVSVPVATSVLCDRGRIVQGDALVDMAGRLLEAGVVPVLMGDMAPDVRGGYTVCSSDTILGCVALGLKAKRGVFLTDVDGVYAEWPPAPNSAPIDLLTVSDAALVKATNGEGADVSLAMRGKLGAALTLAEGGVPCSIHNGLRPGLVVDLLAGKPVPGTLVVCDPSARGDLR